MGHKFPSTNRPLSEQHFPGLLVWQPAPLILSNDKWATTITTISNHQKGESSSRRRRKMLCLYGAPCINTDIHLLWLYAHTHTRARDHHHHQGQRRLLAPCVLQVDCDCCCEWELSERSRSEEGSFTRKEGRQGSLGHLSSSLFSISIIISFFICTIPGKPPYKHTHTYLLTSHKEWLHARTTDTIQYIIHHVKKKGEEGLLTFLFFATLFPEKKTHPVIIIISMLHLRLCALQFKKAKEKKNYLFCAVWLAVLSVGVYPFVCHSLSTHIPNLLIIIRQSYEIIFPLPLKYLWSMPFLTRGSRWCRRIHRLHYISVIIFENF